MEQPNIPKLIVETTFKDWIKKKKSVKILENPYISSTFASFHQLSSFPNSVFKYLHIRHWIKSKIFPDIPEGENKQTIKNKITFHSEASLIYAHMNFIFGFVKMFSSLFHLHNALHMHPDHLHGKVPPAVPVIYQKQLQLSKTFVSFMGALPINQMYLFESSPFFFNGHRVLF